MSTVWVRRSGCPSWCCADHGLVDGEDGWAHHGEPVALDRDVQAYLCTSIDPGTGEEDGPYVLIGSREYTLSQTQALAASLLALAEAGASRREGPGTHSVGP